MSNSSIAPMRSLRTHDVFFMVVAAAAPLAAVVGNGALGVLLGNGAAMPSSYLIAGLVLILFAIGFVRMSPHIQGAGAFYIYIRYGLGRYLGACAAFVAIVIYLAMVIGSAAGFGFFAGLFATENLGIDLPWWLWAGLSILIVALLGYREVSLGARLLSVLLTLEVLILFVLMAAVFAPGTPALVSLDPFMPSNIFSGSLGIGLMFAFVSFLGFESAAIYSEEAQDGHVTVGRALVAAVVFIGIFYALAMWCVVSAFGADKVVAAAAENPGTLVFRAFAQYTNPGFMVAAELLMASSALAATIALHNAASRYLFALGREGMLPAGLGRLHARFQSPHVASLTVSFIAVIATVLFATDGADPLLTVLSSAFGLAALGIILLQAVTSLSVIVFTWRMRDQPGSVVAHLIIAILATLGLTVAAVLVLVNYDTLTGDLGVLNYAPWLIPVAALVGAAIASRRREVKRSQA